MAALSLAGCAAVPRPWTACPAGQQRLRTAQLYFGGKPSAAAFARFVDDELTPRFPDGLTVLDGGAKWRGPENQQMRDAAKIVLIVLPRRGDADEKIAAVRAAYKARFKQEATLRVTRPACVAF